jgi:hypothetical protein
MRLGAEKPLSTFAYYGLPDVYRLIFCQASVQICTKNLQKNEASLIHGIQTFLEHEKSLGLINFFLLFCKI